jgi:hypothetical protein
VELSRAHPSVPPLATMGARTMMPAPRTQQPRQSEVLPRTARVSPLHRDPKARQIEDRVAWAPYDTKRWGIMAVPLCTETQTKL